MLRLTNIACESSVFSTAWTASCGPWAAVSPVPSATRFAKCSTREIAVTVLGHVRRGGSPTPFERILGRRFGVAATDLVARQGFGRMVCLKAGKTDSVSPDEALEYMKFIDPDSEIVHAARAVGATFGDGR